MVGGWSERPVSGRSRVLPARVPAELYERAVIAARARYPSLSALVREALERHVATLERWADEELTTGEAPG
jgi:predicted HicB family RNase H-like nuclease